jgi:outer membrane lipoprotein-sorting protein
MTVILKCVMKKLMMILLFIPFFLLRASAQDMSALIKQVKAKLDQVNDYVGEGNLKTDVSFIKAPAGKIKVWFKKPDKFRLTRNKGISILPKGGVSINLNSIIAGENYVALAAGESIVDGTQTKVVKLLPTDENSDIVLSTMYIDEKALLIRKAVTTTKENGTYEINMSYGKYSNFALPDKVVFSFNTKDYKLPKGITLEFDDNEKSSDPDKLKNRKGKVEINYTSYIINKGVDDSVFKQ